MTPTDGTTGERVSRADGGWDSFQQLLDAMPDAVVIHALDGTIVFMNRQAEVLFGYARSELLGLTMEVLMPERFRERHLEHRAKYLEAPEVRPMGRGLSLYGLRKGGVELPVEISLSPVELGGEQFVISAVRDVTERNEAEAERQRLYEAAEAAVHIRNVFLSSISHDLGNPVAAIRIVSRMLRELKPGALREREMAKGLEQIEEAAERLWKLVEELLDLARLQGGRELELNWQEIDLVTMVRGLVAVQQATTTKHHLRLEAEAPAIVGEWDRTRLERVLNNLLSNAIKYSPSGGEIVVRLGEEMDVQRPDGWAVIEVRDVGVGIPAVDLHQIGERFHRGSNIGHIAGTGIGLSSAKQIVEQHGGMLTIESLEGSGTTVTVRLPQSGPESAP